MSTVPTTVRPAGERGEVGSADAAQRRLHAGPPRPPRGRGGVLDAREAEGCEGPGHEAGRLGAEGARPEISGCAPEVLQCKGRHRPAPFPFSTMWQIMPRAGLGCLPVGRERGLPRNAGRGETHAGGDRRAVGLGTVERAGQLPGRAVARRPVQGLQVHVPAPRGRELPVRPRRDRRFQDLRRVRAPEEQAHAALTEIVACVAGRPTWWNSVPICGTSRSGEPGYLHSDTAHSDSPFPASGLRDEPGVAAVADPTRSRLVAPEERPRSRHPTPRSRHEGSPGASKTRPGQPSV